MQKVMKRALPLLVIAVGIWAAYFALFDDTLFDLTESEVQRLNGCYVVSGQELFRIADQRIHAKGLTVKFKAVHEKGVDNLLLDSGVRISSVDGKPQLIREGSIDKITVIYDRPIRLRLFASDYRPVEASRTAC